MWQEVLQMDGRFVAITLVLTTAHLRMMMTPTSIADLRFMVQWLRQQITHIGKVPEDSLQDARVDETMLEVRQKNYVLACRFFVHVNLLNILLEVVGMSQNPSMVASARVAMLVAVHFFQWAVATGAYHLTKQEVRLFSAGMYLSFVVFVLVAPSEIGTAYGLTIQGFKIVSRLIMTSIFIDTRLSFICQALISSASLISELIIHGTGQLPYMMAVFMEFQYFVACMTLSVVLELLLRSRIQALLDSADAETLVSSFRRVLRGICDGDVLLAGNMTIHGAGDCLQNLLMNRANLHGKAFDQLLPADDREPFSSFIEASTKAAAQPEGAANPPTCMRVTLCGASNTRVRADIFHVPVPHLFGSDTPYHLLAISEDSESRNVPADFAAFEAEKINRDVERMRSRARAASSNSSSASGSSVWQPLPELSGMMLLVDGSSPLLDIEQAHLSFERRAGDEEAESSMPSLRKFCRPTDWESIRRKLDRFVQCTLQNEKEHSAHLKKICLRMPDDPRKFVKAKRVQLSAFHSPHPAQTETSMQLKVCLQLSDFVQDESRQRQHPELVGIQESRLGHARL